MLINIKDIWEKYNPQVTGILHVGAHEAEEDFMYKSVGVQTVVWVEANREKAAQLDKKFTNSDTQIVICAVVGDENGKEVTFHHANNGQSSSIFELGTHEQEHPEVFYTKAETRYTETLADLIEVYNLPKCNFLALDIQGAELLALKGLGKYIDEIDYVYTEVNKNHLYKEGALIGEIDTFLTDFERVETEMTQHGWGDATYIRKSLL